MEVWMNGRRMVDGWMQVDRSFGDGGRIMYVDVM
jgi:hypothetical protein